MNNWLKFFEIITKPIPVASALFLFVATSFFLLASDSTLAKLGLSRVSTDYRWVVGLAFIIAATWLVVTALIWLSKWCYQKWSAYWKQIEQQKRLHRLATDERGILSQYVEGDSRTVMFHSAPDIGAARGLADDGVLYKPDVQPDGVAVAYNILEWALAYLSQAQGIDCSHSPDRDPVEIGNRSEHEDLFEGDGCFRRVCGSNLGGNRVALDVRI